MKRAREEKVITWIFLAFIGFFALAVTLLPQKTFSPSENRYLQKKPAFTVSSFLDGSFGEQYEAYLSDQFPWRDEWIGVKTVSELLRGQKDVNGIYIGKDGYLIERFDIEEIEGETLRKNLDKVSSFALGAAGELGQEHVRLMLVPSASQVMKDELPSWAAPYDQSRVKEALRDLLRREAGEEADQMIVPIEQQLLEQYSSGASSGPLYYQTDHHWTAAGAYVGYRSWAASMDLTPWPSEAFDIRTVSRNFHGTIYSKLNIPWRTDTIELYLPKARQAYRVYYDGSSHYKQTLYEETALQGRDQYTIYLDGNHGLTQIENETVPEERKGKNLLIIKDSFAHSFAPFAVNHYETTYMADLRYLNVNLQDWIETNSITDVLILYQIPGFAKEKTVSKLPSWKSEH